MRLLRDADALLPRLTAALSLALALAAVASPSPSSAQGRDDARARELYLRGDRHYAEGRYEAAIDAFQESYRLSGRPLLLFNLANAYERLGRYEEALASLRRYAPDAPVEEEDQIRTRIENLTRRAEEQAGAEQTGTETPLDGDVGGEATGDPDRAPPPAASGGDETLILAGSVLAGVGGALVLGGAVFGGLALDARGEAEGGCADAGGSTVCDASVQDALDRDATYALIADIGLFGGLAVAATGAVLLVLGLMSDDVSDEGEAAESGDVAPTVGLGPGGGEVGLVGAF